MKNTYMVGKARSGKDTTAGIIAKYTGQNLYALALPIKDIMCALFMWDEEHRDGSYKEIPMVYPITPESLDQAGMLYGKYGLDEYEEFHDCWEKLIVLLNIEIDENFNHYARISPRQAFQLFGTDWGRNVDDEIWLKIAPTRNTIITDVRFDNEAQYFSDLGALGVKVIRPLFGNIASSGHASEAGVQHRFIDYLITNDDTLDELALQAKYTAYEILSRQVTP